MGLHKKEYEVFAVGGITGKSPDRSLSVRVCNVQATSMKDAENQGRRFCSLVGSTLTHIVDKGFLNGEGKIRETVS